MKLSNNALNFLLAQYRAIFKRAYVKGLASAVILTAGLATGQAQAANTTEFYGYTNSITQGWKDPTTTYAYVEFDDTNIRSVLRRLYHSTLDGIKDSDKVIAGAITHYSGSVQGDTEDSVDAIKHLNVIGATNTQLNSEGTGLTLTSNVNSGSLTLGNDGDIALNVVRGGITVQVKTEYTGGAAFAGYAASYGSGSSKTSPAAISVTNSTLTVKDVFYADDAVIAGYALHAQAGTASVSGNTLNYTSNQVKQAAASLYASGAGIPSTMLAAGYARSAGGSADAKGNTMTLSGDASSALTNITEKTYFGGGYATLYKNTNAKNGSTVEASNNSASLSNLRYNAGSTAAKKAVIFGGYANTHDNSDLNAGSATATGNKLSLTDVAITTDTDDTEVSIYGGYANNKTLSNSTDKGSSKVTANSNQLTIDAKAQNGTPIDMSTATDTGAGITIVGGYAEQSTSDKNVTIEAKDNTLTVQGNVQITNADLYGARALNSVTNPTSGGVTSAIGNTLTITGNAIVKDSSLLAASIKAVDNTAGTGIIHEGNKVIVDSNSVVIASNGKTSEIAGDIVDVKGSVWAQKGGTVNFGGVVKEDTTSKYFHGTGSVTGTIYNQGTINVYNELDISQGTIYALGENATINVDGTNTKTAETTPSPLTAGYATLKTTEQQIKDYLTAESASNVKLPVEHISDQEPTEISKSSAGILKVVSGGAVDFGTEVTLSDFNFSNTDTAGAIVVGKNNGDSSYFKADTLTVGHKLASNTNAFSESPTKIENLTGIDASKVHLVANTLNLGSESLTSAQSSEIDFADATASSTINFTVTTGESGADGYILSGASVYGDNYTITNDAASNNSYYTTDTVGQINGKLQITEDGVLGVHNGDWEANDSITLVSGGAILVGKSTVDAIGEPESLPDSTLVLDQALNFQMGPNDSGTVTVTGNNTGAYDYELAQETLGDDGLALLDLTAGINLVDTDGKTITSGSQIQGKATVKATSGGVVLLNGSNISSLLALDNGATETNGGLYLKAESGAALVIARDTGALNVGFGDFVSTDVAGINLSGDGILVADTINVTEPTPTNGKGEDDSASGFVTNYVDFAGTVHVADLTISDERRASNHTGFVKEAGIKSGTVYVYNSLTSSNATLQLGKADEADTEGADINLVTPYVGDSGTVSVANIQLNNNSQFNVLNGKWDADNTAFNLTESGSMTIGGGGEDFAGDYFVAILEAKSITMAAGTKLTVANNGTATFATADFSDLAADADANDGTAVTIYGSLTINDATITSESGAATTTYALFGGDGAITIGNHGKLTFGEAATSHAIISGDGSYANGAEVTAAMQEGYGKIRNQGGMLTLGLGGDVVFENKEAIMTLKSELFTEDSLDADGILENGGILNIGQAHFRGYEVNEVTIGGVAGYQQSWDNLKSFADVYSPDTTNQYFTHTNVNEIDVSDEVKGHWGSLTMNTSTSSGTQVLLAGDTSLSFASGNNGNFISDSTHNTPLGAVVFAGKSLTLNNGGNIGKITLQAGDDKFGANETYWVSTSLVVNGTGKTVVAAIEGTPANSGYTNVLVTKGAAAEVTNDISNIADVEAIDATLNVMGNSTSHYVGVEGTGAMSVGKTLTTSEAYVNAGTLTAKDFQFNNTHNDDAVTIINGGHLTTEDFTVTGTQAGDGTIFVGLDGSALAEHNLAEGTTGTGFFEVTNALWLNGATLVVDPDYDQATSIASVNKFQTSNAEDFTLNKTGTINGSVQVGANAALGIGSADVAEVSQAIAQYQQGGALKADQYGSILYLNGQIDVADGSEIALNADQDATDIRSSLVYQISDAKTGGAETHQYADMGLGANTAVLMTEKAFDNEAGDRQGTAVEFKTQNAVVNGAGGEIVLVGSFDTTKPLNFFNDAGGNGVTVEGSITVRSQNGFLVTVLSGENQGMSKSMEVNEPEARRIMTDASDPVLNTLIAYGNRGTTNSGDTSGEPESPTDPDAGSGSGTNEGNGGFIEVNPGEGNNSASKSIAWTKLTPAAGSDNSGNNEPPATTASTGSSSFLDDVIWTSHGAPAEQAARLGVYGGSAQVGLAAAGSNADVLASRFGIGANSQSLNLASNGMGGTLWVAPIYKSQDSDGFAAQGLNYGVDFDLYGVALGGDYKVTNEITVGAMFNVGSGDLDGQGNTAAAGVSNDFDYFGFGIYGAYQAGALTVTADASFTQVDNDLEGNNEVGKVSASADTTAWSLGVTGQYQFTFASIDVTPHAGLRFTSLDLDDYGVNAAGHGTVANFDSDTMSVFSIPVGVTFAKSFKSETWTVTPALDLQVTGQFGDDEAEGSVSWSGTNLTTNVTSEVFDNFTYGATVGVEAESASGFSFGLGLGYTGSSNVDEFAAQANARFTF